jgi:hypothetical protein
MGYQIKQNEMGEACDTYGINELCLQGLGGGGSERKRLLGRTRRRCKGNIRMDLQVIEWDQKLYWPGLE